MGPHYCTTNLVQLRRPTPTSKHAFLHVSQVQEIRNQTHSRNCKCIKNKTKTSIYIYTYICTYIGNLVLFCNVIMFDPFIFQCLLNYRYHIFYLITTVIILCSTQTFSLSNKLKKYMLEHLTNTRG